MMAHDDPVDWPSFIEPQHERKRGRASGHFLEGDVRRSRMRRPHIHPRVWRHAFTKQPRHARPDGYRVRGGNGRRLEPEVKTTLQGLGDRMREPHAKLRRASMSVWHNEESPPVGRPQVRRRSTRHDRPPHAVGRSTYDHAGLIRQRTPARPGTLARPHTFRPFARPLLTAAQPLDGGPLANRLLRGGCNRPAPPPLPPPPHTPPRPPHLPAHH